MQFNIYVPKDKVHIIRLLENIAKEQNRQKNELVLEALERYLPDKPAELGLFHLGKAKLPTREELYESRLDV